jgi:hypothetical protein
MSCISRIVAGSFNSLDDSLYGGVTVLGKKLDGGDEREHAAFPQ